MNWTKDDTRQLRIHLRDKALFGTEIAELMGKRPGCVRYQMHKLGVIPRQRNSKSARLAEWNNKHKDVRKSVMTFFMKHTAAETQERFGLTETEFKSLMTCGYQMPSFAHLRKDGRRKDLWTFTEAIELLRYSGLQPRAWIAKKLKRGTYQAVKEMASRLKISLRYVNGIPSKWTEELLGYEVAGYKVKAGASPPGVDYRPIIVPWVVLYSEARRSKNVPEHILGAIKAMSRFQKRIHGTRGINDTCAAIEAILRRR